MKQDVVTVEDLIVDRRTGLVGWAVVAAFVRGPKGEPVCIDYRVRQVRPARDDVASTRSAALANGHQTLDGMRLDIESEWPGVGNFDSAGIPRHVFESASQRAMIEKAHALLARDSQATRGLDDAARAMLAAPARKPGRPPARSLVEKLRILADVEAAFANGWTLNVVAHEHHMSRSAVRDLLSWARRDADPALFTTLGSTRKGGALTPAARALLDQLTKEV